MFQNQEGRVGIVGGEGVVEGGHRFPVADSGSGEDPRVRDRIPHALQRDVTRDAELTAHRQRQRHVLAVLDVAKTLHVAALRVRGRNHRQLGAASASQSL